MRTSAVTIAVMVSVACSSCGVPVKSGISRNTDNLRAYWLAKEELARSIQNELTSGQDNRYRLIPIVGPGYPVGTLIPSDNPLDVESRDCTVSQGDLPAEEAWAAMPGTNHTTTVLFDVDAPFPDAWQPRLEAASEQSAERGLAFDIKNIGTANFEVNGLSQRLLSRQETRLALQSENCAEVVAGIETDAFFVRGLVRGTESLTSERTIDLNSSVNVFGDQAADFRFEIDRVGSFKLSETSPTPKFMIVTRVTRQIDMSGGQQVTVIDFSRPSDNDLDLFRLLQ